MSGSVVGRMGLQLSSATPSATPSATADSWLSVSSDDNLTESLVSANEESKGTVLIVFVTGFLLYFIGRWFTYTCYQRPLGVISQWPSKSACFHS